jgi:uncharacterized glyoxalase superfamily protein PhnB
MGQINTGLANNGRTSHYQISYDSSLSATDGRDRANALIAKCEEDFALMKSWFGGIDIPFNYPLPVHINNASGGASWHCPSRLQRGLGVGTSVEVNPGSGTPVSFLRYLLVSEVTEMFMLEQDKGWHEDESFVQASDEGSKGEGLSRFLGYQLLLAKGLDTSAVKTNNFLVTHLWINGPRLNYVDNNPDDRGADDINGCTTLFIYYLHDQLGKSINSIIAAGASTLAGVYKNLTGQTDGWSSFIGVVDRYYPFGYTYDPAGDGFFPVSNLSSLYLVQSQIILGYNDILEIHIDRPAMAEVNVHLSSDDDTLLIVPFDATIAIGATSANVTLRAAAKPLPFAAKPVVVHVSYAGKTLSTTVQVVPPTIASFTITPGTVVSGNNATGRLTLTQASKNGDVKVDMTNPDSFYAKVPAQVTVPQGSPFVDFPIEVPNQLLAFPTKTESIMASYAGTNLFATLLVTPSVVAGILKSLTIVPNTVVGGEIATGTVTLIEGVPVNTVVGLAALEPGPLRLNNKSAVASVDSKITIPPMSTAYNFRITTNELPPHTSRTAVIMAGAVVQKTAVLRVTG